MNERFLEAVRRIPEIGLDYHRARLLENARANLLYIKDSIRNIVDRPKRVLIISAGPSLRMNLLVELRGTIFSGTIVAVDGAYLECLRRGIVPDYVLTLDPHPTRIVRWFGGYVDTKEDDYFARQDLAQLETTDASLVARNANRSDLIIASCSPSNVEEHTRDFATRYWFSPLVDSPFFPGSLTRELAEITKLPALNTGGTSGTCAIVFAHEILKAKDIAVIGMDLAYYKDLPRERTQSWNMLKDEPTDELYPTVEHPDWGPCYTDPTYWSYRQNLLGMLKQGNFSITNCTGHGALYGPRVNCIDLEQWLKSS